jgi:hypothetical protein
MMLAVIIPILQGLVCNEELPMYILDRSVTLLALLPMLSGAPSCTPVGPPNGTYAVRTFEFVHTNPPQNNGEAIPNIWINTNTKVSSLYGGTLTSSLPCAVMMDYTDNTRSFKDAVITAVKVTYDDNTLDSAFEAVNLPLHFVAREYESVNSVAGGGIVTVKCGLISGRIPNVITHAEPFRLQLEGYFTRSDDTRLPFSIDQHFDIKTENSVKKAADVLQDQ